MSDHLYTLFETAIGPCGIAWGPRGITGVQLPGSSAEKTRQRLLRRCPGAEEGAPRPTSPGSSSGSARCYAAGATTWPTCRSTSAACR
ncbi:hypothetical protein, partial [Inquilinus limosus]|uniref:hypothetical protein n=1 Tax=Inquilinus limosus TaxID=171674 RepID=UPI001930BA6B